MVRTWSTFELTCILTLSTSVGVVMAAEVAPAKTPKKTLTDRDSSRVSAKNERNSGRENDKIQISIIKYMHTAVYS